MSLFTRVMGWINSDKKVVKPLPRSDISVDEVDESIKRTKHDDGVVEDIY